MSTHDCTGCETCAPEYGDQAERHPPLMTREAEDLRAGKVEAERTIALLSEELANAKERVEEYRREVERRDELLRGAEQDRDTAQVLVAKMHAAAVGEIRGPTVGPVEDVAALRAALVQCVEALEGFDEDAPQPLPAYFDAAIAVGRKVLP